MSPPASGSLQVSHKCFKHVCVAFCGFLDMEQVWIVPQLYLVRGVMKVPWHVLYGSLPVVSLVRSSLGSSLGRWCALHCFPPFSIAFLFLAQLSIAPLRWPCHLCVKSNLESQCAMDNASCRLEKLRHDALSIAHCCPLLRHVPHPQAQAPRQPDAFGGGCGRCAVVWRCL